MLKLHTSTRRSLGNFLAICGLLLAFTPTAHASDHGCKVLLCLANPNGPKAVSECVPDINKLFHDLSKGRPFPTCEMASSPETGGPSWAQQGWSYYDPCPSGTKALESGSLAIQGSASTPKRFYNNSEAFHTGIGEGDGLSPYDDRQLGQKVCVGNEVGTTYVSNYDGYRSRSSMAGVYDRVVLLDPAGSPNIIDVFVNSTLYRRVRW
ncbi:hypothetical protein [Aquabacterium sp. CECT 9606]|uniref:hypothetical protein n=1 Tax=Aquabacterium sp. CECT 9606 TaxID=2845822 RepID=UPI001E38C332|nr:hypothetical protein [Aquabacterium sp. CECT 9606]